MSPVGGIARFGVLLTQEGAEAVQASLQRIANQVRQVGLATKGARREGTELGRSFRNIALRTIAIIGLVRSFRLVTGAFRDAVAAGISYNETIEQSRLAIASLIAAQGDLINAQGEQVEGVEKLDAAYELAVDQVRKLRIAGIQTAATTKELVDAFQQAVGAGLATGLTLDEIRVVTIRIAQAAGALGVPYRQLNEEIRSILGGIIDQNTRIAKALGITNDQVRAAKEQNRLADFLLEKFEAFGVAGERIVETWAALKSNVQETLELFSGEVTFPAFEAVRTRGLIAVQRIFDFDTAEISREFSEIVRTLQNVFAGVGDQIAGAFEGALDKAVQLNDWLLRNQEAVSRTTFQVGELVAGMGQLIGGVTRVGLGITKWGVELGIVAQLIETIADGMKIIGQNRVLSAGVFLGGVIGVFALLNAVFGPTVLTVAGITTAVTGAIAALDYFTDSAAEAADELSRLNDLQTQAIVGTTQTAQAAKALAAEYEEIAGALREGTVETDKVEEAKARLVAIQDELGRILPEYVSAIRNAADEEGAYAEAIKKVTQARRGEIVAQIAYNRIAEVEATRRLAELQAEVEAIGGRFPITTKIARFTIENLTPGGVRRTNEIQALQRQLEELAENAIITREELAALDKLLLGTEYTLTSGAAGDPAAELKALRAEVDLEVERIKQKLREEEAKLKAQFDKNLISYVQYYDELNYIQQQAAREEIAQYNRLIGREEDPEKESQVRQKILRAESEARIKLIENELAQRREGIKFADTAAKVQVQFLEAIGRTAEATRLKLRTEWQETIDDLRTAGEYGAEKINLIKKLINIEVAKAQFEKLEELVARYQRRLRDRINEIEAQQEIGALRPDQAQVLIADEYQKLYGVVEKLLPKMEDLSAAIGDPDTADRVEELRSQLRQMGLEIANLRDTWREFREEVGQRAENVLSKYLSDAVLEAENLSDAVTNLVGSLEGFRNLLGNLVAAIVEVTAQLIAQRLVMAAMSLFNPAAAVAGAATGGPVGKASGGVIRGPGTPTSDSILARLSTGEYVIRAASVQKYGVPFFNALNAGALPRDVTDLKRFATGGMVGNSGPPSLQEFRGELTVGLSEGLVLSHLDSPAGERFVLKIINKHRRGVRDSLGV